MRVDAVWPKASAPVALFGLFCLACSTPEPEGPLSWEEFREQAVQEEETGVYVVNGDELAETEQDLATAYERYRSGLAAGGIGSTRSGLAVNQVSGVDDRWSAAAALNLTYCISSKSFGSQYAAVVAAMNQAAAAWEGAAQVDFVHDSASDPRCSRTSPVVFNVRQVCTRQYLARAFFPSTGRRNREILIDCTSFGNIAPYSLAGVLRHELGHALGFRHEHTRPEAGTCFEDTRWRALTSYDPASVMHYPQCNGSNTGDLALTGLDVQGAGALYGAP
jgi:hypothetical protein